MVIFFCRAESRPIFVFFLFDSNQPLQFSRMKNAAVSMSSSQIEQDFNRSLRASKSPSRYIRSLPPIGKFDSYLRLLVNSDALERLKRGESAEELTRAWPPGLENF